MRKIINHKVYDTETAERLLYYHWLTHHQNLSGKPCLNHERGVYRTKKGALFGHAYDEIGYGRDRNGVTGAFTREESGILPFEDAKTAVAWCEAEDVFDAEAIEQHLGEAIEEA